MTDAVQLWFACALLEDGWAQGVRIALQDGYIAAVTADVAPLPGEERHGAALPGLSNVHSHAFQRGMAGLAETRGAGPDDFWTWREVMYRFLDRMGPDDVEAIASQAYAEMLEAGFTRVGEFHYLHHDPEGGAYADRAELMTRITAAAVQTGIALTLLPVFYAQGGFGGQPHTHGQRRFISGVDGFAELVGGARRAVAGLPGAVVGIAPHSLRAVDINQLAAILPLAEGGPVHIHVAEQVKEVTDCLAATGSRPIQLLLDHAPVDGRWCLIHATHANADEWRRMAAYGAVAGLCPVTEANLGDGIFPTAAFLAAGGRFGVGTDSNVRIGAAGELRALEYAQRLSYRARNVLGPEGGGSTGRRLFDGALAGGHQALGAGPAGLTPGCPADIVSLNMEHPGLVARSGDALLDSWSFAEAPGMVDCVWRHGVQVVASGRHRERGPIARRFCTVMRRMLT